MNGLAVDHGKTIRELKDVFAGYGRSLRSSVDLSMVANLQHQRGARQYRLTVLKRRRNEAVDDRTRLETEIRGYRKALSLFGDPPSGGAGRSTTRLLRRVDSRIGELSERSAEVDEIESEIDGVASELQSVEERLVDEWHECVAEVASQHAAHSAAVQLRARTQGETLADELAPMWSPTPVLAYRVWGLRSDGLYGAWSRWTDATNTARCTSGSGVPHTDGRCSDVAFGCGIYAAKDMVPLLRSVGVTLKQDFAAGLVALEGKVVEHERGYRAERARVLSLVIVHGGIMTIVDGEAEVRGVFVDPSQGGSELLLLPASEDDDCVRRTIAEELKKREEGQPTWT